MNHTFRPDGFCSECFVKQEAVEDCLAPKVCWVKHFQGLENRLSCALKDLGGKTLQEKEDDVIEIIASICPTNERREYAKGLIERLLTFV